jgi:hypothetical protein
MISTDLLWFDKRLFRLGQQRKQESLNFLKSSQQNWKDVKIVVYDAPQAMDKSYTERLSILLQSTVYFLHFITKLDIQGHPILSVASVVRCENKEHLASYFKQVCDRGGEGIDLRNPTAWYFAKNGFFRKKVKRLKSLF